MHPKLQLLSQIYESSVESNKAIDFNALLKACFFNTFKDAIESLEPIQQVYFAYLCSCSVLRLIKRGVEEEKEMYQAGLRSLNTICELLENPENENISLYVLKNESNEFFKTRATSLFYKGDDVISNVFTSIQYTIHSAFCFKKSKKSRPSWDAILAYSYAITALFLHKKNLTNPENISSEKEIEKENEQLFLSFLIQAIKYSPGSIQPPHKLLKAF